MNEALEDQLRRVLSATALDQVPTSTPVPPLRLDPAAPVLALRPARRHPWVWPTAVGVAAALIAIFATLILVKADRPSVARPTAAQVTVPLVQGMTLPQAMTELSAVGLIVGRQTSARSSTVPAGKIIDQTPGVGSLLDRGRPVDLVVSLGVAAVTVPPSPTAVSTSVTSAAPQMVKVPAGLVGMSYDAAAAALEGAGFQVRKVTADGIEPDNQVQKVSSATGANLEPGATVTLTVSNNQLFTMPNLANLKVDVAATQLIRLGWTGRADQISVRGMPTTDSGIIGLIAGSSQPLPNPGGSRITTDTAPQVPAAGIAAKKSASITVVVFTGKKVLVPSFTAEVTAVDELTGLLQEAGLSNITVTTEPAPSAAQADTVRSMDPAPGSSVDFDRAVTITAWGGYTPPTTTSSK